MNKKLKTGLLIMVVLAFSISMMAFRPFGGDGDEDGIPDQTETLAEVLGIDVETLQAAYETAKDQAQEQALADGKITQEQLDAMEDKEFAGGKRPAGFRGAKSGEFLAEALGITEDELQVAQQEAHQVILDQALEDGTITQEKYDEMMERGLNKPDFENGEFPSRPGKDGDFGEHSDLTLEERVDQALEDGKITEEQAEAILNGELPFGKGPGGPGHGGRKPGGRMRPGDGQSPEAESTESN